MAGPKVKSLAAEGDGRRRLIPTSVAGYEDEIARWKRKAEIDGRALSNWLRMRVLQAEAIEEEKATRFVHSPSTASDERQ